MNIVKLVSRAIHRGWKAGLLGIAALVLFNNSIISFFQVIIQDSSLTLQNFSSIWISRALEMVQGEQLIAVLTAGIVSGASAAGYYLWHNFRSKNFDGVAGIIIALVGGLSFLLLPGTLFSFAKMFSLIIILFGIGFVLSQSG